MKRGQSSRGTVAAKPDPGKPTESSNCFNRVSPIPKSNIQNVISRLQHEVASGLCINL
jgi:hypothetical protein